MPVPVPVVGDPEGDGLVVASAQLRQEFRIEGWIAPGHCRIDGLVGVAQRVNNVGGPRLQAAGAEPGDRAAVADDVLAALLHPGQLRQELLVGGVPVADQEAGEERQDRGGRGGLPGAQCPKPGQSPVRGTHDKHVRRARVLPGQPGMRVY